MPTNHPHNNFFEKVFSMPDVATDFFDQLLEEKYRKHLDLSQLRLLDKSHVTEFLRKTHSDLIFETVLNEEEIIRIAILLEHKSSPPTDPYPQIIHYISSIHQANIIREEDLIPVLPILFYHGKKRLKLKSFTESFPKLPKTFHQFIPTFEIILIDLDEISDEYIDNLKPSFLKNALLILKHFGEKEYLIQNTKKVFEGIDKIKSEERRTALYETLINYMVISTNFKENEMKQVSAQLPPEPGKVFISYADRLIAKGKIEGYQINDIIKNIVFCLNLLTQHPNMSLREIANLTSTKVDFVKKIKEGFESGDAKKARKVVFSFFKEFENLDEMIVQKLEGILKEFVPIFSKKKR